MEIDPLSYWSLWVPLVLLGTVVAIALYFVRISDRR